MTLGQFVFRLRARLQDRRNNLGQIITNISESGKRWSIDELLEIINFSIVELVRLVRLYASKSKDDLIRLAESAVQVSGNISVTSGVGTIPSDILTITSLNYNSRDYIYRVPYQFFSISSTESVAPTSEVRMFTVLFDLATSTRKLYVFPSVSGSFSYTGIYGKSNYGISDQNSEIYIYGLDDLLLDIAELECREREGNIERATLLNQRIFLKLGIVKEASNGQ